MSSAKAASDAETKLVTVGGLSDVMKNDRVALPSYHCRLINIWLFDNKKLNVEHSGYVLGMDSERTVQVKQPSGRLTTAI